MLLSREKTLSVPFFFLGESLSIHSKLKIKELLPFSIQPLIICCSVERVKSILPPYFLPVRVLANSQQ